MRKRTHDEISTQRVSRGSFEMYPRLPIYALIDNVRSLYNVGSIFRTSDGAWISKLFLTGFTPHPPRKEIEKTALGSTDTVPWEYYKDPVVPIRQMKQQGIKICVLELTTKSFPYTEVKTEDFPLCLVIGNEITGVSHPIIDEADFAIEIPMFGTKQSLNVGVAYGIAVFELVRIIKKNNSPTNP